MADKPIYLPKQTVRHGVAGYRGKNIVVVDPKAAPKAASKAKVVGAPDDEA